MTEEARKPQYTHNYQLTAGQSDATARMPLSMLTQRIIEVSTEHANLLEVGFEQLERRNIGWVLSRMSIVVDRYPGINERYSLTTWIESYNRHLCERAGVMTDGDGREIAHFRSTWAVIDMSTRLMADISDFEREAFPLGGRSCPVPRALRLPPLPQGAAVQDYTFQYRDIDFNRHVNTVRYLDLILNHWPLDHYDVQEVGRLDLWFHHECRFAEQVQLRVYTSDRHSECEIVRDGTRAVGASLEWRNSPAPTPTARVEGS